MTNRARFLILSALLTSACRAPSHAGLDLEGPSLLGSDLVAGDERGPSDPIRLWFSEPIEPAALEEQRIVLVPFELGALCSHALGCPGGWRCHRGRCQRDPILTGWLSDLANPPLSAAHLAQTVPLCGELDESATELTLRPRHPLAPHRLHTLLVGPVRDRAGNLVQLPGPGAVVAFQEVFATAGSDRAHASLELRSPAAGEVEVPTNLGRVVLQTSRPVRGLTAGSIWLELATGERIDLVPRERSALCQLSAARTCHELVVAGPLPPLSQVELRASTTITDDLGQPLHEAELPGPSAAMFATAASPDLVPPRIEALELVHGDRCVVVRARCSEVCDLTLAGDWLDVELGVVGAVWHELGVAAPQGIGHFGVVLSDLAGNRASLPLELVDGRDPPPRIVISEVLANPAGPEPAQELIELVNLEDRELDLTGFQIDDGDDGIGVDLLPTAVIGPGGYAVVVGAKYNQGGHADPPPATSAVLVRLAGTLGDGGLGNLGERIALRDPSGRLVSSYGAHHGASATNGQSVERLDLRGCDLEKNWRPRPDGSSSPGWPADGQGPEWGW